MTMHTVRYWRCNHRRREQMLKDMKQLAICHDLTHQLSFHQYPVSMYPSLLAHSQTKLSTYIDTITINIISTVTTQSSKKPYSYVVPSASVNSWFLTSAGLLTQLGDKNLLKNNIYSSLIHACVLSCFSCVLLCNSRDCTLPGSSVYGILQARILEWLPSPPPGDLPNPGMGPMSPVLAAGLPLAPPGKPLLDPCACQVASVLSNSLPPDGL